MDSFEFYSPTRFVFGRESEKKTGDLVRRCGGTKVLLHFGGGSVKVNGIYDKVVASLTQAEVPFIPLGGVQPNPRSGLVREGIDLCRREKVDFILAVGGGSVIDSAKAIAFGTVYAGDFADYYFGKDVKAPKPVPAALPIGAVLTIAAAGSEGSANSIINLEPGNLKRGATGEALRPKFAILNPMFTYTLPPFQTACGAVDIFAHLVERYFTPTQDVMVSDELCEGLMRSVVVASVKALAEPTDFAARSDLMWAGSLAHNNVCGAGRVQDWASHGIEHELSALYDCAHGAGLAVVMPAWMDYVKDTDLARFARFAEKVFGVAPADKTLMVDEGIARYRAWIHSLGLPLTFRELGAKAEDIPALVAKLGLNGNTLGRFRPLKDDDVAKILESCAR
ncbi:MAG: iron-containing alcohol dehydrogenase [bacterium]|nr:iron-containing alcohol dehydrogenase [bacterium]